ncbi:MAG: glycosyltransferase family 2 protein [Lentisphaeria bacterium]|nr:glycosyltransferase family 2 protein [Lentisphaeria bacterium]
MKRITLLIPARNEAENLERLYAALRQTVAAMPGYRWRILFVDDGSTDHTLTILRQFHARDHRVEYLSLSRNFGKEAAMLAGFEHFDDDAMVLLDADMQDPPELIPELVKWWEQGYDDVYARRRTRGKESRLRKWFSLTFYRLLQASTSLELLPNVGDFRLLDRRCVRALTALQEHNRYTKGFFCWIGFRKKEIVFDRGDRIAGRSSWSLWSLFGLALNGFLTFTTFPLRVAILLGLGVSGFAFCYGLWVIFKTICWGEPVAGYPTLLVVTLFLGGVQLLALGVIGEYLGRTFEESKHRPHYLIAEQNGKKI